MLVKVYGQVFHQAKNNAHAALEGTIRTCRENCPQKDHLHTMPMCDHLNQCVSPQQTANFQQTEAQMHFCSER